MFTFKIFEIPDGKSQRTVELTPEDIDLGEVPLVGGSINLEFEKAQQFIRVNLQIDATVLLICDRSLDEFEYRIQPSYEILFKNEPVVEATDINGAIRNIDQASKQINIEQDVLDTILVNLPAKKLHPRFLDEYGNPLEFETATFGISDEEGEAVTDPRWAALKKLKN